MLHFRWFVLLSAPVGQVPLVVSFQGGVVPIDGVSDYHWLMCLLTLMIGLSCMFSVGLIVFRFLL